MTTQRRITIGSEYVSIGGRSARIIANVCRDGQEILICDRVIHRSAEAYGPWSADGPVVTVFTRSTQPCKVTAHD